MDDEPDPTLRALNHPMRRRVLRTIANATATGMSPREVARGLHEPLSNVSYHVRVLAECRLIVLLRTEQVRGSRAHFYVADIREPWARRILDSGGEV